eukprot:CAMPEP_0168340042 /NCGR_PEP_ID=MMETSP0213-20121227/13830_1 /TAXON_ID=151035 /ORGANISM="Euplotes harpa, Strain FSP1.4" /LENGTH=195 /DNA_ID=CAMNT_0008346207 /DNA_START=46 /DNA_END=633 /DNA_ORIENTATION=+
MVWSSTQAAPTSYRADWNRDGVIDWQDGWRTDWNGDGFLGWGEGFPGGYSYGWSEEYPVGYGWGEGYPVGYGQGWNAGAWPVDWNRDGIVDWRDNWVGTQPISAPVTTYATAAPVVRNAAPAVSYAAPAINYAAAPRVATTQYATAAPARATVAAPRVAGAYPAAQGTLVRGDWNRDGVIDGRDGWRVLENASQE